MTWIEENEMDIFTAVVYSDQDKLLEYNCSPGNGLPLDIVFFALVMKNIEMIEFLLVDLKYEWYDYYAVYLKNFMEEERMKIRDFFQLVRADQWLSAYRLAMLTDNVSNLEYLCMFDYDLTDVRLCYFFWTFRHSTVLNKEVVGTNRVGRCQGSEKFDWQEPRKIDYWLEQTIFIFCYPSLGRFQIQPLVDK